MPENQERKFNSVFAHNLNNLMAKQDLSQAELARRIGVSAQAVSNWCNGTKIPRMDTVDKICKLFGLRREDLMTDYSSPRVEPPVLFGEKLTQDEIELIMQYRAASDVQKKAALTAALALLKEALK